MIAPTPRSTTSARGIGADVPFFLHASPAFYVGGGDVLATEYPALPATPVVLVKPREASVSTIEAYRRFDEAPVPADKPGAIASALRSGDAETAYALVHNNFGRYLRANGTADPNGARLATRTGRYRCRRCVDRVPARLPFAIRPPRPKGLPMLPSKTAGGPARRSSFPARFASTCQRSKNFSSTRRKSLLL